MSEEDIFYRLDELLKILKRMEERQILTTRMVEEVEQKEQQVGSYASTDHGET